MIIAMLAVYLLLWAGAVRHRRVQRLLEGVAIHRVAAQSRSVHPDRMGNAAGAGACRAPLGGDRAECCGRSDEVPVESAELTDRYLEEHAQRFKRSAGADGRNLRIHILPQWSKWRYDQIIRLLGSLSFPKSL
jgi:hypothetical protein